MTMREQWIAAYKQKYASCCRQGEREKASGKGRDSGRKRRGKSQIESESQSRGGFDLITALEHAVCQSKFLHDFSFLQCLLRNMSRLKASRDVVQIRSFFRLVGALPLAEQWATFVLIHEESLELDLDDLLLSSFLGHVKATVQNMFPGRGLEDGFRAIDLLRITQEEMREGDIVDNMNLVLLFVDILLSYEPSQEEQERVISLIQIAASSHTFDFSWRRIFIEVLLNAKALEVSSSVDGGEICELLLSHQNMVGVPGGKSKDELLSEVAGPGCFMRIDTLIFCLQALESGAEEFQSARKHVLSILLIKLKMLFGREVKYTAGGDVDGNHKEAEEEKEKEFIFRCFYRLEEFNTRMQYVLKEVVNTFFSYCNMNAMIGHSKVVRQHYHYFDVVCGRKSAKAQKIDWSLVLESDSILLKDNNVEDKVVVLCLLQETVKYFTRCGHSIEELVGVMKWAMKRESLVKLFKVATGHGTTPTSRGKSEWMESKRVLEDKPYSCLANAFTVLLHFQLITQPNEIVITAALAVLKELQPFVSMENVDDKGDHKSSNRSVHDLVVRELLLASLLADANLPMKLSSVLSCMFAYLKQDAQTVNRKLCSLFSESAEAEAEAESKEQYHTFFHLMDTFYKPYFSLKSKSYASTKASQGPEGDHFFQILFTMIELLLEIVDFPAKEILWNSESVTLKKGMDKSKIKAVLEMSQSCLEILQIIFVEYGLDLEACNDKLKCRVERSSMMFDYILSKLLHAMKLYESSKEEEEEEGGGEEGGGEGEGVGFVSQRSADQQARGSDCLDMYHSVKNFVTKSIETFSIEKAQKKEQEKAGKRSESASQVEDTRQEQKPSTAVRARDTSDDHREKREALTQKRTRRKTSKRSRNAYINAALQGEGYYKDFDGDELDDLEDFIVCKPGRNYDQVLAKRAPPSSRKTKKVSKAVPAKVQSLEMNH